MTSLSTGYGNSLCYQAALDSYCWQESIFGEATHWTDATGTRHLKYGVQSQFRAIVVYFLDSHSRNKSTHARRVRRERNVA